MSVLEQEPTYGLGSILDLDFGEEFDLNDALQSAISDIATNRELELDQKIIRMEQAIELGTSESFHAFIDMRQLASRIEFHCNHDHELQRSIQNSESLSGVLDAHKDDNHPHNHSEHKDKLDDDEEIDPRTGKKRKRRSWSIWFRTA